MPNSINESTEVRLHFLDYWRIIKVRAGLITLAFLLVMVTAGVTTYFLPREYYSKVTGEVKPDNSSTIDPVNGNPSGSRQTADPAYIATQFQILQKTQILYPVIQTLKLGEEWAIEGKPLDQQTVYLKLLGMLDLHEVRNTGLIEIGVYSTDKKEAANIANTIAVTYREKRLSDLQSNIERGLAQVREETEKLRKRVEEAGAEMAKIRQRDSILDSDPESLSSTLNTADRNVVTLEQQLNEQRLVVTRIKGNLEQIMKLKPEELREVLRTLNIDDQNVVKMVAAMQEGFSEESRLQANGLGEKHPRIEAIRKQREYYSRVLSESLTSVTQNQAAKLEIEERNLTTLQAKFDDAMKNQIADKQKTGPYFDAKSQYLSSKKLLEAAQLRISTELFNQKNFFEPFKIWEPAEPAVYTKRPNVPAYMGLAALVGLIVGVSLAFFIEYLDTSVKTLEDVEKYLQIPVLAVVPKDISELIKTTGDTPDAEAYRILRANVEFNKPDRNANTFTLVSGGPGEGKSTTLNNLAYTCAQGGYNVLVVDADLRRPTQHKFFEQENDFGLTDYLTGHATIDEITRTTKIDNLSFIPSGNLPGEAIGILNSQRMVDLIAKVKGQYDLAFFDAPPILGVSDGSVLASECDITIMVVQHRRFPRAMLQRVKQAVSHAGGTLIGVVLNNVDSKHDDGYSYYNAYNDYYAPKRKDAPPRRTTGAPRAATTTAATPTRPRADREEY